MIGALHGVRVVEFASYVAGPYAGMLLGDLGAEVTRTSTSGSSVKGAVLIAPSYGLAGRTASAAYSFTQP